MPNRSESPTIRLAVLGLAVVALTAAAGIIGLSAMDRLQDAALAALSGLAGGAVGALATLLTTFTPSPIPGGRRVSDALSPTGAVPGEPETMTQAYITVQPPPAPPGG